jgi:hypothetical protein
MLDRGGGVPPYGPHGLQVGVAERIRNRLGEPVGLKVQPGAKPGGRGEVVALAVAGVDRER